MQTVYIVDDDDGLRGGLKLLFESVGLRVETYGSAQEFLAGIRPEKEGCLVLDIRMPGMGGLDLQERLAAQNVTLPVIILTGHGDVPAAVRALKGGAVDFMEKPFNTQALIDRVQQALERDTEQRRRNEECALITSRLERLTPREREVMDLIVAGKANKVIALDLGISERTVELHRARLMEKMEVRSLAELIHSMVVLGGETASRPGD